MTGYLPSHGWGRRFNPYIAHHFPRLFSASFISATHWRAALRASVWHSFDPVCSRRVHGMKELPLANGTVALVSEEDWCIVSRFSWSNRGGGYVRARMSKKHGGDGKRFIYLHRLIMGEPEGKVVDHIDGNPLNNTRANLQVVSQSRNCMKSRTAKAASGVYAHRHRWRARLRIDGQQVSLGVYATKQEAETAVESARRVAWEESKSRY